jgi:SAM-dependent methyltransferase
MPVVADRFLAPWDPVYGPPFYRRLREEMRRQFPELDTGPVSAVIEANGYPDNVLIRDVNAVETLSLDSDSIDIVISNAVFEHLDNHVLAVQQLYRITRPGGWNFHQVDFRYHRSFERPLEHLLLAPETFEAQSRYCFRETGTYLRPSQLAALFRECGFAEVRFEPHMWAEPAYFQDFLGRLRRTPQSAFCQSPEEELRPLGGLFRVRKGG